MQRPMDRQRSQPTRADREARAAFLGHHAERFSDYFNFNTDEEGKPLSAVESTRKARLPVTRLELLSMLEQHYRAINAARFWPTLWRWLTSRRAWWQAKLPPSSTVEIDPSPPMPEERQGG